MSVSVRDKIRDFYIILIIIMIGALIRIPIGNITSVDSTFLYDQDSYFYARESLELFNKPFSEWKVTIDRATDPLMNMVFLEDDGSTEALLPICIALLCKIFTFIPINRAIYCFCAIICTFSAIPTYIFVKKHSNTFGAIVSSLAMAIAPSYFAHSMAGYCDTDGMIMVFAVTLLLCLIESIFAKKKLCKCLLCILSIITTLLFYLTWSKYYVYVFISVFVIVVISIINYIKKLKLSIACTWITECLLLTFCVINSYDDFVDYIILLLGNKSNWPNQSMYIGELAKTVLVKNGPNDLFYVAPSGLFNWIGGLPYVVAIVFGIVVLTRVYRKNARKKEFDITATVIVSLTAWAIAVLPITFIGIRFVQLLALPLNLLLGIIFGKIYENVDLLVLSKPVINLLSLLVICLLFGTFMICNIYLAMVVSLLLLLFVIVNNNISIKQILIALLFSTFLCPLFNEYAIVKSNTPIVSEDLSEAVEYLNKKSSENDAIVSWWNKGYYYQYATNRQVVADGGIYNGAYFYWLSNIFTTDDERLSIGISKMLQGGSLEAVAILNEQINDESVISEILKKILVMDRNEAEKLLITEYQFDKDYICRLLEYTHPKIDGEVYIIVEDEMKELAPVIMYFGLWDFKEEKIFEDFTIVMNKDGSRDYIYPNEMKNTVLSKLFDGKNLNGIEKVFSNKTVSIYKIVSGEYGD